MSTKKKTFRKHACEKCGKNFSNLRHKKLHEKSHESSLKDKTQSSPYCNECEIPFASIYNLKHHMRRCHKDDISSVNSLKKSFIKHTCEKCGKNFTNLRHKKLHQKSHETDQKGRGQSSTYCSKCEIKFQNLSNLRKHALKFHPDEMSTILPPKKTHKYTCETCGRNFNDMSHMRCHQKTHGISVENTNPNRKCPLCPYIHSKKIKLHEHFEEKHNLLLHEETLEFNSLHLFNKWKHRIQQETTSSYVKECGDCTLPTHKIIRLKCHRSGRYIPEGKGVRQLKALGSHKINAYCPSSIKLTLKPDGHCVVNFIKTHVGHKNDIAYLNLTAEERQFIAAKIAAETPFSIILNDLLDSVPATEVRRIHLLTTKDLHNIASSLQAQIRHEKKLALDAKINDFRSAVNGTIDKITTIEELEALQKLYDSFEPTLDAMHVGKQGNEDFYLNGKLQDPDIQIEIQKDSDTEESTTIEISLMQDP